MSRTVVLKADSLPPERNSAVCLQAKMAFPRYGIQRFSSGVRVSDKREICNQTHAAPSNNSLLVSKYRKET